MIKPIFSSTFFLYLFLLTTAHAATCDAGYYLKNGECVECNPNNQARYCPGDDTYHSCPTTDTDYNDNPFGYILDDGRETGYALSTASDVSDCKCIVNFHDEHGNRFRMEAPFNGENYWGDIKLWYQAGPGYYLSSYKATSYNKDWYLGVKACTNEIPEYSHYSGPGTPDEPKTGGVTDYNDCPWACDDGYSLHNGACVPLCAPNMRYLKTGNGLQFNLYPVQYSSPALHIKRDNTICYGVLVPGNAPNAINLNYEGTVYHTEN